MATSPNKGYELQTTGSNEDTWGDVLNDDALSIIDDNLGGIASKTLSGSDVDLTADESAMLVCRLSGLLSANVLVRTLAVGMTLVENLTTGAFTVTFGCNPSVGTPVEIRQGTAAVIATDPTNGPRKVADNASEFASGTVAFFGQTSAPTGWTKDTSVNNAALRLVSGSVVGGGTVDFTTAFASQTPAGTIGGTALTIAQMPVHSHNITRVGDNNSDTVAPPAGSNGGGIRSVTEPVSSTGGGETHTHTFTGSAINLAVKYADVIRATKD